MHREHINVSRIVKQLKELLYQMDTLRGQVLDADITQFDKLTTNARASLMSAIKEYLGRMQSYYSFMLPVRRSDNDRITLTFLQICS